MSITSQADLSGIRKASSAVAITLRRMREYAAAGLSTRELDLFGGTMLSSFGARSAPAISYGFPAFTCISVNHEAAHGIPSEKTILQEGDLVNIDVSAEVDGYYADNGCSFVLGNDRNGHQALVDASRDILLAAISHIRGGLRIATLGQFIEHSAKVRGFQTIKNLVGHGIGRNLHEAPAEIPCFYDRTNTSRFKKDSVVAVETFISTKARIVHELENGWTLAARDGSFVAQHEHTIVVTGGDPIILTHENDI